MATTTASKPKFVLGSKRGFSKDDMPSPKTQSRSKSDDEIMTAPDKSKKREAIDVPIDPVKDYMLKHKNASLDEAKKAVKEQMKKDGTWVEPEKKKKTDDKKVDDKKVDDKNGKLANGKEITEQQYKSAQEAVKKASFPVSTVDISGPGGAKIEGYKGIYREDAKKVITVVSEDYHLLPNREVFEPVLEFLDKKKVKFVIDRFTHITDQRSRIHLTFPDIQIKDDSKEGILASLFLHNSYNMTEAFKMVAGAMRQVCKNGMVIGVAIKKMKVIHQAESIREIAKANLEAVMNGLHDNSKHVEARIRQLRQEKADIAMFHQIVNQFGTGVLAYVMKDYQLADQDDKNGSMVSLLDEMTDKDVKHVGQWDLYNKLTYYHSHVLPQRYRLDFISKTGKMFKV